MRGKNAKRLRKKIYGDFSPRREVRKYSVAKPKGIGIVKKESTQIVADEKRQAYQKAKKEL